MARVRLHGALSDRGRAELELRWFNSLPAAQARQVLDQECGLDGTAGGVAQGGLQEDEPAGRQPLAHDAQLGLGLDGDVEADRSFGAVGRAADPEAPAVLGVGAGAVGDAGDGVGERLCQARTAAEPREGLVRPERAGLATAAGAGEQGQRPDR